MERREKLILFREMILCCHNLYLWTYDRAQELLDSNCPDEALVSTLFAAGSHIQTLYDYAVEHEDPVLLGNAVNMLWIAVPDWEEGEMRYVHVLGPFFSDDFSIEQVELQLQEMHLSAALQQQSISFLRTLPVISLNRIFEYAIMLCYLVSGRRITISDIHYEDAREKRSARDGASGAQTQVHGTYEAEQEMLRMVREGNLNYRAQMNRISMTGTQGRLSNGEPMRQMKNAVLVCIVLFSRAAIEGGLSPEVSLTLTDRYFQAVEASRSIGELSEITHAMQDDFITRVHRCREDGCSRAIRDCCDYINLHLEEELTLAALADKLGYSEYYFSRKFKKEVGCSPKEYIRRQRLERARTLLRDPAESIQTISERLQFCSLSYFSESFRKEYGITPSQFREQI